MRVKVCSKRNKIRVDPEFRGICTQTRHSESRSPDHKRVWSRYLSGGLQSTDIFDIYELSVRQRII